MNIGDLKKIIKDLPDDALVLYSDPNFTGAYWVTPDEYDFNIEQKDGKDALLIRFPFEEPCE